MARLQGKTALVTGGSSGIGLAAARLLLREEARVFLTGRDDRKLAQAHRGLHGGERCAFAAADVADPEQVREMVRRCNARFGPVDILVNNAGLNIKERTFRQLTPESWQKLLRANLDGAFYCTHAVLPQMLQRRDGVIVNVNSIAGKRASPLGGPPYAASKFAMSALR